MIKLFDTIVKNNISPNGLYVLYCIENRKKPVSINESFEIRILQADGLLDDDYEITNKAIEIINKIESNYEVEDNKIKKKSGLTNQDKTNIVLYRELFPKGNLPSGSPSRSPIKDLEKRFLWFFNNYDYSWDVIIKATKKYINQYESEGYKFMKTSGYFIYKSGIDKTTTSLLATYCDMILEGDDDISLNADGYNSAI